MSTLTGKTVGIVGLGQIGGSLAGALQASGPAIKLVGFDTDSALLREAMKRSILDTAAASVSETIKLSDIVVLAVPIGAIIEIISKQAELLGEKLLVTDVGSVMGDVNQAAESAGLRNFVSGHPMVGSEKRGVVAWDPGLFQGGQYFTTSPSQTASDTMALLETLIDLLGAEPTEVAAEQHDLALATTSNLVHVLAYSLRRAHGALADKVSDHDLFVGPSFKGATRVADSDPEMVFQMLWHNRRYLAGALSRLSGELTTVCEALTNNRPDLIRGLLNCD